MHGFATLHIQVNRRRIGYNYTTFILARTYVLQRKRVGVRKRERQITQQSNDNYLATTCFMCSDRRK